MSTMPLTPEQQKVVLHPRGKHARVLAVAGSGKTTTMVERIAYLLLKERVEPDQICVLMFNRRAREQFDEKLAERLTDLPVPKASTFHAFSYTQIRKAMGLGLLPATSDVWVGDREEMVRRTLHTAINNLVKRGEIEPDSVDPEQANESIGLWKGSLIPPERAGHRANSHLPLVYREFERLRMEKNAITFDDFVPLAVGLLETEAGMASGVINRFEAVIVDEYQDVNYGQQRLVELIAGTRADIMVVGDDDQTIYEWRGARPTYIIDEFPCVFSNKPTVDYLLSRTFRFGPVLAQSAENVIAFNQRRVTKSIIAHRGEQPARVHFLVDETEQVTDVHKEMADQVKGLLRQGHLPTEIVVLARMFVQFAGLEAEFLTQRIPYRVLGKAPFFERTEVDSLLKYLQLALSLNERLTIETIEAFMSILNVPNRRLARDPVKVLLQGAALSGLTLRRALALLTDPLDSPFSQASRTRMDDLTDVLLGLHERTRIVPTVTAGRLLEWLVTRMNYAGHYDNYYGAGEDSEERKITIREFIRYAKSLNMSVPDFLAHIASLDTTLGFPADQQILMTTIFRVKGEEFEYVFIPNCLEGYMPCLYSTEQLVFDKAGQISEPEVSTALESERRLFYVALTRAKKSVFVGTSKPPKKGAQTSSATIVPSRFLEEMQLESVEAVMGLAQKILAGESRNLPLLVEALRKFAGHKPMIRNLLIAYASGDGPVQLDAPTADRLLAVPEVQFSYIVPYETPATTRVTATVKQAAKREWWDD